MESASGYARFCRVFDRFNRIVEYQARKASENCQTKEIYGFQRANPQNKFV